MLRRILIRLSLVLATLAATVFALELFVRHADPYGLSFIEDVQLYFNGALEPADVRPEGRLFRHHPNLALELHNSHLLTDDRGLRCGDSARRTAPREAGADRETFRVLFLGDSVTFAWGVEDEESWVRLLEGQARAADGRPLECLNAGHLKYNTLQELALLELEGPELLPDAVVLTFIVNDLEDTWAEYGPLLAPQEFEAQAAAAPAPGWFELRAASWTPDLHRFYRFLRSRGETAAGQPVEAGDVEEHPLFVEGWPRVEAGLDGIRRACLELGAELVVLDHSVPRIPRVAQWCASQGVPCFDVRFSAEEEALGIRNSVADMHANALGNRLFAAKALAALEQRGLVQAREARGD